MTDSPQQKITKSGWRGNLGRWTSDSPPPTVTLCLRPDWVGVQFGWVKIISPEVRYTRPKHQGAYILVRCTGCGKETWTNRANLTRGVSQGCQSCSQPKQIPMWLDRRLTAAKDRCTNPRCRQYKDYGARGITFDFPSVTEAGLWVIANLGLDRTKEIDRIDNNLGYAPGNLRWATRDQQHANRRNTKTSLEHVLWGRTKSPYSRHTTVRLLSTGMTPDQIVARAKEAVRTQAKCWRSIQSRLVSEGYMTL